MATDTAPSNDALTESNTTVWCETDPNLTIFGADMLESAWSLARSTPVVRHDGGGVLVIGPEVAAAAMHSPGIFSSGPDAVFLGSEDGLIPIQKDPPEHRRYRRLLDPSFSPRVVAGLEQAIVDHTNACIDAFIDTGECDLVPDLGIPVPSATILALLGFPAERLDEFLAIKDGIFRPAAEPGTPEWEAAKAEAGARAYAFFTSVLDDRASAPQDDFATHLVELEAAGEITRSQSFDICLMLLLAGLDTVTATIANMMLILAERPDLRARIVEDPTVIPAAVEELLRYTATVPHSPRVVTEDAVIGGCPFTKGEKAAVMFTIGNFDPEVFEDPSRIDFDREGNRHFSFGLGKHRCLGSHLARLELQVLIREWHRRIPEYRLADGFVPTWRRGIRDMGSLPLRF